MALPPILEEAVNLIQHLQWLKGEECWVKDSEVSVKLSIR